MRRIHAPFTRRKGTSERIRSSGPAADDNPFRWSTKYTDSESGLVYYGYRYYNAEMGRWISRDPVAEDGGLNFYAFCANHAVYGRDSLGLFVEDDDDDLDLRLQVAAEASAFVATYAYNGDLYDWHHRVMEEGMDTMKEAGKQLALAVGFQLAGGVASKFVAGAFAKTAMAMGPALSKVAPRLVGKTVLGKSATYVTYAESVGARRFYIPPEITSTWSTEAVWEANKTFLRRMVARGDDILLDHFVASIETETGFFWRELDFLRDLGYRLSADGRMMIR